MLKSASLEVKLWLASCVTNYIQNILCYWICTMFYWGNDNKTLFQVYPQSFTLPNLHISFHYSSSPCLSPPFYIHSQILFFLFTVFYILLFLIPKTWWSFLFSPTCSSSLPFILYSPLLPSPKSHSDNRSASHRNKCTGLSWYLCRT